VHDGCHSRTDPLRREARGLVRILGSGIVFGESRAEHNFGLTTTCTAIMWGQLVTGSPDIGTLPRQTGAS